MAVYGYTTKKDLTSIGKILFMALIGLIIATVVNMFLKSPGFDYILSYVGVAVFTGLTAWDSQKIKHDAPDTVRRERRCSEVGSHRSLDLVPRLHQPVPLPASHLREATRTKFQQKSEVRNQQFFLVYKQKQRLACPPRVSQPLYVFYQKQMISKPNLENSDAKISFFSETSGFIW